MSELNNELRSLTEADEKRLAELDEQLAKFEAQKRWSDVIKTVLAKVDVHVDPVAKVDLLTQAGTLYVEKSSNQAEAIKVFERVLQIEPRNADALARLRDMYEKRRDWENMIRIRRIESEDLDDASRAQAYFEMAQIATEKIRKPEICIELWREVLAFDPEHPEALAQLTGLYERAREWNALADVIEKQLSRGLDSATELTLLQKLGAIYADKLNDDDGALRVFFRVLELDPNERRAQEQVKKRLVTLRRWDELEQFYASTDKWDEFLRTIEREAENKDAATEERIDLYFRIARIWQTYKGKLDRAAKGYEKVLELDSTNLDAAVALSPIYEQVNDSKKLAGVLEIRLLHSEDPSEKLALLVEAGALYEQKLRDPATAFDRYLAAFATDPQQESVREDALRVVAAVNGWDRLIAAYEKAIEDAPTEDVLVELRLQLGELLRGVDRKPAAIAQFRAVYELRDDETRAMDALENLLREAGSHADLLGILQRRHELEADPETRRGHAYAIAMLHENELSNADEAIAAYESIISEYGDYEQDAVSALERIFQAQSKWQDLASLYERRIELGPDEAELASLKFRLGRVFETQLQDAARAIELYREVLALAPDHDGARAALEAMLDDATLGAFAAEILEPIYEGREDWESLIRALHVLGEQASDASTKRTFLARIGDVCLVRIGDTRRAFDAYARALSVEPEHEETLAQLEGLAANDNRYADLVKLLDELAGKASDPTLARSLRWRVATLQQEALGSIDGAIAALRKILEANAADVDALIVIEGLYRQAERWQDVVQTQRARVNAAQSTEEQIALLDEMAVVYEAALKDLDAAILVQREIVDLDGTNLTALVNLDRLLEAQSMWTDLADNVSAQLAIATDDAEQLRLMMRLGDIREHRLGLVEAAVQTYREVLERDPSHGGSLAALERLVAVEAQQASVAEILEGYYEAQGEIAKLIGILEIQAKRAGSPSQRIDLLRRIAELSEVALGDAEQSFDALVRALGEDPTANDIHEEVERVAHAGGSIAKAAVAFEAQAATSAEDASLVATLLSRAARIREEQLGDVDGAIGLYERVLVADPTNIDAATALERLFQATERYEALARIYLVKANLLDVVDEKKDYFFRAAAIFEDLLERAPDAIPVYQSVLALDEEDLNATDKLIEIFLRLSKWNELLATYQRKTDIVADVEEKKLILIQVGAVYERELNDLPKAIATYERILELDPDDTSALARLDVLYQNAERWNELLAVIEHEAELAADSGERLAYRYRISALFEGPLADSTRAVEGYREILEEDPNHAPTVDALERMIAAGSEPLAAATVLERVYRGQGEAQKLIAALEVQVKNEADATRRVELLHQIAETAENALDDHRVAFGALARAFPLDSTYEPTLVSLERLAAVLDQWAPVGELYDQEIERLIAAQEAQRVVELAMRTAAIYEVQLGHPESAIARYRKAAAADETHAPAYVALDRLLEATEQWADLADVLRHESQLAETPDDALALQFRLGQTLEHRLSRVSDAIAQYREILAAAPEYERAREALESLFERRIDSLVIAEILEPLYRIAENWERLIGVFVVQLEHQKDQDERVAMMHRIAELAEERAGDAHVAFEWYLRVLLEVPGNEQSLAESERLAAALDAWDRFANTLADVADDSRFSIETRVAVALRIAQTYETKLEDIEKAEEGYRFVLSLDAKNAEALESLDRIYAEQGAWAALATVLATRAAVTTDDKDALVLLLFRLGKIYENDLDRADDAIAAYTRVADQVDPQHLDSLRALENIYIARRDWASLTGVLRKQVDAVFGDSAQSEVYAKLARVEYDYQQDADKAIEHWRKVLDLRGEDVEALNALGDIYAARENWRDLVDVLEREVSIVDDDATKISLYDDLGRVWYEKLQRERNAFENWERILDIDPSNTDALFSFAAVYRTQGQKRELVDTLLRVIDVGAATLDDANLVRVYLELGALYERDLDQATDAAEAFEKAVAIDPRSQEGLDSLERVYMVGERWEDVVTVKERRIAVTEDKQAQLRELLAVAKIWDEKVGDSDRGTSSLQKVLEIDPRSDEAFGKLEALHRAALRWNDLVEMYLSRFEISQSTSERLRLLRAVAKVKEVYLEDRNEAFDALQIAWTEDFEDAPTITELERLAASTQRWSELLETANNSLREVTDPQVKIAICLCCARWYGSELKHPEYAIPYYQQILAIDANNLPATRQMAGLYRETFQWQQLAQVLGRIAELTRDEAERMDMYVQLGELHETQLDQSDVAMQHYDKALTVTGAAAHPGALESLERVFRAREDWPKLLDVLRRQLAVKPDPRDQISVRVRVAEAYEEKVQDYDRAIDVYREVLAIDDRNIDALRGLTSLYDRRQRWTELLAVLEKELEVVETDKERISALSRIGALLETEFVKPERASERFEQVLEIDPNNVPALVALERIYRGLKRWDDVLRTLERHVDATSDRIEKVELYRRIGDVYMHDQVDLDRAVDAYSNILSISSGDVSALEALSKLHEKKGDASASLDVLEQLSKHIGDPVQSVDLRFRMGKLLDEQLGDRASAIDKYESALDVDPSHLPSLEAMRRIHTEGGDFLSASRVLEREVQYQTNARSLAKLYVDLGKIYDEHLDEHDRAVVAFEAAYEQDADNEDAAMPLAKEYFAKEAWERVLPIVELLTKRANRRPTEEQQQLWFMLGTAAAKSNKDELAAKALGNAHSLDPQHGPSLQMLAEVSYRLQDWDKAFKLYQMMLLQEADGISTEATTEVYYRLGAIKKTQGDRRKAINMWEKALEQDAYHRPTLEAMVDIALAGNENDQAIHYKKQLLEIATPEQRYTLLDEIGDLYAQKLNDPARAIENYVEASTVDTKNHVVLHKLLGLYQQTRQWTSAVDIIERISELETRPTARAKYLYTIGVIIRDELQDLQGAIQRFDLALDLDPTQLKPFEAINKVYTQQKDWRNLERAFRKMIHRVLQSENKDLLWSLWHNLGIIYRDRLQKFESAAEAFKMASGYRPEDLEEHQILAELYGLIPGRTADAIGEHQFILRQDVHRVDSYRALYKLYFEAREYDKAWCVASTLVFLRKADAEQQQFYEQYRVRGMIRPTSRLTNEKWLKDLFHPEEDRYVGKVFEAIRPALYRLRAQTDKARGLNPKMLEKPESTATITQMFRSFTQVLGFPSAPRLFLLKDKPGWLLHVAGESPATVSGSTLMSGVQLPQLAFIIGHHLSYYRDEHYVTKLLETQDELKLALLAAVAVAGFMPAADPAVAQWAAVLGPEIQKQPREMENLRAACKLFVDTGARTNIKQWLQTVELTACRVGLLLAGELDVAQQTLTVLPPAGPQDLPPADKFKDLVLFSVSEEYFSLRQAIGITINIA